MEERPAYYPALLNLTNRRCAVVGGGTIALRKTESLIASQADVVVISPEVCDGLERWIRSGRVQFQRKIFDPVDIEDAFLVVAATNRREVNHAVFQTCEQTKTLVNVVDEPSECSFIVPAVVREGPIVISISTSGKSPTIAKELKSSLLQDIRHHSTTFQGKLRALMTDGGFE